MIWRMTVEQEDVEHGFRNLAVFLEMPSHIARARARYLDSHLEIRGDAVDLREFGGWKVIVAYGEEISRWWYTEPYAWRDAGNGPACNPKWGVW